MKILRLLMILMNKHKFLPALVLLISTSVILSSVGLFSIAAYMIAYCSLTPSIAEIAVSVVAVRFFGIARGVLRYLERLISHDTTFRLLSDLRNRLYHQISHADMSEIMQMDKADAFSRLVDDIERLQEFYLRTFNPYATSLFIGIAGTIMLSFFILPIAQVFVFFYALAIIVLPVILYTFTKGLHKKHIEAFSKLKWIKLELLSGLADIIAASARYKWENTIQVQAESVYVIEKKLALWKSFASNMTVLLMNLAMLFAIAIASVGVASGNFKIVFVPVVAYAVLSLFEGAQPVASILQKLEQSKVAAERVFELEDRCVKSTSPIENVSQAELNSNNNTDEIQVQNVSFQYVSMTKPLLKDINFTLNKGKRVAIIGPSGSGKSTLSYLLLGWLKPTVGSIEYGEKNEEELFSVVNQQVYFFNRSIHHNLLIADSNADEADIEKALKDVGLSVFIKELPDGLQTEVGEGDTLLSGGQRQRLAIARALLRKSPFLICDEITAGLDPITEKKVLEAVFEATAHLGLLVITHRLVAMEAFDEIIVLEEGRIVERGSHKELMLKGDLYYKSYQVQQQYMSF